MSSSIFSSIFSGNRGTVSGLLNLGMGLYQAKQAYDAGKDAEDAADRNADRIRRENEERARRLERQQRKRQSELRARAAASGIAVSSGSTKTFLDDYIQEDERQLSWLQNSGEERAALEQKRGDEEKEKARHRATAQFFSAASNWWGS